MRTDEELKEIAKGIINNTIFCSLQVKQQHLIPQVFLPIALGGLTEDKAKDIGMVYAPMEERCPHAINGYPMFMSFSICTMEETRKVMDYHDKIRAALDSI